MVCLQQTIVLVWRRVHSPKSSLTRCFRKISLFLPMQRRENLLLQATRVEVGNATCTSSDPPAALSGASTDCQAREEATTLWTTAQDGHAKGQTQTHQTFAVFIDVPVLHEISSFCRRKRGVESNSQSNRSPQRSFSWEPHDLHVAGSPYWRGYLRQAKDICNCRIMSRCLILTVSKRGSSAEMSLNLCVRLRILLKLMRTSGCSRYWRELLFFFSFSGMKDGLAKLSTLETSLNQIMPL